MARLYKILIIISLVATAACSKKKIEELASEDLIPELAGSGEFCTNITDNSFGTDLNGTSYTSWLTMNADGTYSYNVLFGSGACANAQVSGGDNYLSYGQQGTWRPVGLSSTVSGAVNVEFTMTSSDVTVRATLTKGTNMRAYLNASCGFALAGSPATTSPNAAGQSCTATASHILPNFPAQLTNKNIVGIDSGNFGTGSRSSILTPGYHVYPSSISEVYINW